MPPTLLPIDPAMKEQLRTLENVLDEEQVKELFTGFMQEFFEKSVQIREVHIEVMRCRSRRCVLCYEIKAFEVDQQRDLTWRVIGKVLKPEVGQNTFANMQQLWTHGFARCTHDGISIPEPLGFIPSLCLLLQEEVPGVTVKTLLQQGGQEKHFRQLARALVKLHTRSLVPGKPFTVRDHLGRCHPKHQFLSLACPQLGSAIDYIVDRAFSIENDFGDIQRVPIHGDFHLGQVHMENGRAWLVDFDALCYSDPAADLGNLLVFLKSKAHRVPALNEFMHAFLEEYFSVMNPDIAARIPLYEALTHLRRACKCLRLQEDGWQQRAQQMVESGVAAINEMAPVYRA
ncbi:MAG TPA: aminoglycoside phosphotransferase family protein [bacterium]